MRPTGRAAAPRLGSGADGGGASGCWLPSSDGRSRTLRRRSSGRRTGGSASLTPHLCEAVGGSRRHVPIVRQPVVGPAVRGSQRHFASTGGWAASQPAEVEVGGVGDGAWAPVLKRRAGGPVVDGPSGGGLIVRGPARSREHRDTPDTVVLVDPHVDDRRGDIGCRCGSIVVGCGDAPNRSPSTVMRQPSLRRPSIVAAGSASTLSAASSAASAVARPLGGRPGVRT